MGRIRTAAIGGLVEDNPLASGATTLTSAGLSALPLFAAGDFALVVFDPNGRTGEPFAKRISAHASNATTATIDATAIYGTARSIAQGVPWRLTDILDQDGNGSGLIGYKSYNPAQTSVSSTSATHADIDATNLKVDFVVPPSGSVVVQLQAWADISGATATMLAWSVREGAADILARDILYSGASSSLNNCVMGEFPVSGLTPGALKTYKWGQARRLGTGTVSTYYGGSIGPAVMKVLAVNV